MKRWFISLGLVLSLILIAPAPVLAAPEGGEVAQKLICQCGCLSILNNCSHAECQSRETMLGIIKQKITQGQSAEQIVQGFVSQYGEAVLAEPPKKGFNLTAWLFPFVGLAVGTAAVYIALRKWVRRRESSVSVVPESEQNDEEYRRQLEKELRDFPDWGFR